VDAPSLERELKLLAGGLVLDIAKLKTQVATLEQENAELRGYGTTAAQHWAVGIGRQGCGDEFGDGGRRLCAVVECPDGCRGQLHRPGGCRGGGFRLGVSFVGRAAPVLAVGGAAAYLAAARMCGAAPAGPGIATAGTPGVPSWLASQGNAAAKACDANGQSCLPG